MPPVTYRYTYKYSGPVSANAFTSSPPVYSPGQQYHRKRQYRSTSTPKEGKPSRPVHFTVNNHHYGQSQSQCKNHHLSHITQPENDSGIHSDEDDYLPKHVEGYYRHANETLNAQFYPRGTYTAYDSSSMYNVLSYPLPSCPSMQPPPIPPAYEHLIASPMPTTPIGCIIPGMNIALNIPLHHANTSTPSDSRKKGAVTYGYIFPKQHATIHLIEPEYFPFNGLNGFRFQVYKVPTCLTVGDFMDQVIPANTGSKDFYSARGIIECKQLDNRSWGMGQEFWVGGPRGDVQSMRAAVRNFTLEDIGWTEDKSPIWVARTFV